MGDGNSPEWRQVIIDRPAQKGLFKGTFIHSPILSAASGTHSRTDAARSLKVDLAEDDILMAPSNPRILGSGYLEHQEFLAKAWQLYDEDGMTVPGIVDQLNAEQNAKWERTKAVQERDGRTATIAPHPITPADVQHALKHFETAALELPPQQLRPAPAKDSVTAPPLGLRGAAHRQPPQRSAFDATMLGQSPRQHSPESRAAL